jgi:phosphoribosylglycinamide formyltransferase-1
MSQIVIFASGSGTNAEAIIRYFSTKSVRVGAVFCNNPQAGVVDKAKSLGVQLELFDKTQLVEGDVLSRLQAYRPDLIVLAGFIWMFPKAILEVFPKVVNIHPALLPKYGGKGMYGTYVHQAVLENKELKTGITIHYVNEHYDEGAIIAQFETSIETCTTAVCIAAKIHELEQQHFPKVIAQILETK